MKKLIVVTLGVVLLFFPETVQAHIYTSDVTGSTGAIMHITPADDPIAGEISRIYISVNDEILTTETVAVLTVEGQNTFDTLETSIKQSTVAASYTFPRRGVYEINLTLSSSASEPIVFREEVRVNRGVGQPLINNNQATAEILLIISITFMLVLGIFIVNRRRMLRDYIYEKNK